MIKNQFKHVAIIMDGNGRWAKSHHHRRTFGHKRGVEVVREIAIRANDLGIQVLTLYAFSTENWKRPLEEVNYLMKLPFYFFEKYLAELMEKNIRIQMIGEMDGIPEDTARVFKKAIEKTSVNTGMILCFAMNYGAQAEIVRGVNRAIVDAKAGKIDHVDTTTFQNYLYTKDYPPLDCMIRTSGEMRISNFLLYQLAYAELLFVDVPWPEFMPDVFEAALQQLSHRDRRFGGIKNG